MKHFLSVLFALYSLPGLLSSRMNSNIDVNLIIHRDLLGVGNDPFLALQGAISLSLPPDVLLRSEAFIQETR